MKNKTTSSEMKEIILVMMLDKLKRIAEDTFEKDVKEKQRELTMDEETDLIEGLVHFRTVISVYLGVPAEELERCIYMNFR